MRSAIIDSEGLGHPKKMQYSGKLRLIVGKDPYELAPWKFYFQFYFQYHIWMCSSFIHASTAKDLKCLSEAYQGHCIDPTPHESTLSNGTLY